jgi:hypothetical protein
MRVLAPNLFSFPFTMSPLVKVKATRVLTRQAALSAAAASRRPFPAWIAADESGVAFPARTGVSLRIRDGLVLRPVSKNKVTSGKSARAQGASHDHDAR